MRIVVHHSKHYDWEPVPADVEVTEADKKSDRVRPGAHGGWLMKVTRTFQNHTEVHLDEATIVHAIFHQDVRAMRLTRRQGVALALQKYILQQHTHPRWITDVEVHDEGPQVEVMRAELAPHVGGVIEADELEEHLAAYGESTGSTVAEHSAAHVEHLKLHFKVRAPKAVS